MIEYGVNVEGLDHPVFQITPYIEQMGPTSTGGRKEFWWEREWRLAGRELALLPPDVVAVLAPEAEHDDLRAALESQRVTRGYRPAFFDGLAMIDPRWGLERIIARLAGVPDNRAGPFPP